MLTAQRDGWGNVTVGDAGAGGKRRFVCPTLVITTVFEEELQPEKKPICDDVTLFSDKSSESVSSRRSWKRLKVTYNVALSLKTCVKTINSNEKSFNFASVFSILK